MFTNIYIVLQYAHVNIFLYIVLDLYYTHMDIFCVYKNEGQINKE